MTDGLLVARWLLFYAALTAAALPIARLAFPAAPDDGAGFAVPIATAVVTLVAFYVGQVSFGPWTALASLAALAGAGALAHSVGERRGLDGYDWRRVAGAFGVFAAGFLFVVSLRAMNPAMSGWGGEKFLHTGLLNAVLRAGALPPEHMWYAGEPVRYYYGLPVFNAVAALVTDTPVEYVHNLAIAGYFGTLVVAAYSLTGWITRDRGYSRRLGGALGVFFVALAGNTVTVVRFALGLLPEDLAIEYGRAAFNLNRASYPGVLFEQSRPATWGWWDTRYVVEGTLQEFPLYSFVKADMHGHTVTTGFLVLAAGLAYAYVQTPRRARRRRVALLVAGLGGVAGYFGVTNTWSMPSAVGMAWLACVYADPHPATLLPGWLGDRLRDLGPDPDRSTLARVVAEAWRTVTAAVVAVAVGVVGYALASPFLLANVPPNEGVGLFPPRTTAVGVLLLYGALLALFAAYLGTRWTAPRNASPRAVVAGVVAAAAGVAVATQAGDLGGVAVLLPVVAVAWIAMRTRDSAGFEATLAVAGVGLLLSMELVHARVHPFELARWNTTLKVAIQGWVFAGLAAGPVAVVLASDLRDAAADVSPAALRGSAGPALSGGVVAVVLAFAVVASSLFTPLVVATDVVEPYQDGVEPTLDGYADHREDHPEQVAAMEWFEAEVSETESVLWMERPTGTPTFVEKPGLRRGWQNPVSTVTGLPAVAGWFHETGYRGDAPYEQRVDDVEVLYETPDDRSRAILIDKYDVEYVWVGPLERERYDVADFAADPGITDVYENDAVTIYAVDRDELVDHPAD
jgi:YYY domain-containing protein